MPAPKKIIITEAEAGKRLDLILSEKLQLSRSQVQKLIKKNLILVNNSLPKKAGDNVSANSTISFKQEEEKPKKTAGTKNKTVPALALKPKIISETDDYIVIEKPTGMLTHPTMAGETDTLADFITAKFPEIKKVGEDPLRPGIVHRLDKEASGLLVIARTQKMFNHLKEQFKNRTIEKEYLALAHGKVQREWGEINFPIARSENGDRMAAIPATTGKAKPGSDAQGVSSAREAKTEFWIEKQFVNFTLLRIKIYTGRMHQIRVHLLAYNHPLVGDPLYFQKKQKRTWDEKLGRLFLHSAKLGFADLAGEKQLFESPLPKILSNFLKELK